MKHLRTAPTEAGFFEVYARLSKSIRASGIAAQIVSALTEVGGIYAAAYSALLPIFPAFAMYVAGIIALIGTAVIELGLRVLAPHTVDAILYRRFSGLHLPMTVAIWLLTAVLITTSGVLSFRNSKVIVEEFTPVVELGTTAPADSLFRGESARRAAQYTADSAAISTRYAEQIEASEKAAEGREKAARRELSNLYNQEKRTGSSFATQKDRVRQKLADLEAEAAAALAALRAAQAEELAAAREDYRGALARAEADLRAAVGEVKASNLEAEADRAATVAEYGGGLGYFTIVCLAVFLAAVVLERIHHRGSGIEEKVELSQYDLNPSAWVEALTALRERWQYILRSRITAFAERTPAPPLPVPAPELYDPAQAANITVTLKIEREVDGEKVIYIEPKRRAIGFRTSSTPPADPDGDAEADHTGAHENSRAIKGTGASAPDLDLRQLRQRLKDYKKRLGRHHQKALVQERKNGTATRRTLDAIANNQQWVEHYTRLIQETEGNLKNGKA